MRHIRRRIGLICSLLLVSGCGAKPLDFDCAESELAPHVVDYSASPLIREIQRDAGSDFGTPKSAVSGNEEGVAPFTPAADPIERALADADKAPSGSEEAPSEPRRLLLLSGGGAWGAFGAGFLNDMHAKGKLPHFDAITGISTGAIQSIFAVAGRYDLMEKEYVDDRPLAKAGSYRSVLNNGYLNDTAPLAKRLAEAICPKDGDCVLLKAIADAGRPLDANGQPRRTTRLVIGMVETRSGDFRAVDVTALAQAAFDRPEGERQAAVRRAGTCVAGVVMASSAVPVQLRPVRLRDAASGTFRTYTDGGVRLSVFEARVADAIEAAQRSNAAPVEIYVVRNGPTVVKPNELEGTGPMAKVDKQPDAGKVGLMSYSTLVNQNEIMSIASLRLTNPRNRLLLATADGFATPQTWRPPARLCPKKDDQKEAFNHAFMVCLAQWGHDKAVNYPSPWIELRTIGKGI